MPHEEGMAGIQAEAPPILRPLARIVFFTFLLSFVAARMLVYLIMAKKVPDLFLHVGGTHVHHLNYGIFLLSGLCGWLLFFRPAGRWLKTTAALYAFALALTFDEFGMWLHLGGGYWQRASFDAVVVVAALLGLLAFAPGWRAIRTAHVYTLLVALLATGMFFYGWRQSFAYAERNWAPHFDTLEQDSPL